MINKTLILTISIFLYQICITAQIPVRNYDSIYKKINIDSIKKQYPKLSVYPVEFENQIFIAVSNYPELKNVNISVKCNFLTTTMSSFPNIFSLFCKKEKRKYVLTINNRKNFNGILLRDAPINAQIGVFAHEFEHVSDYQSRNIWRIIGRGFDYLTYKSKRKYEKEIDSLTITAGYGWQIYDWSYYTMHNSKATESYKKFKARIYMSADEILQQIKCNQNYYDKK